MKERLKAGLWVQAQLRLCDIHLISAMVVRKGDPDSGSVLLKINRFEDGCAVFIPITDINGDRAWMHGMRNGFGRERDVDAYITRQITRDEDLWVLEIEDHKGQYELDAPLVEG